MGIYPKTILSLFSGIGGLDLAVKLVFPQARTVAYVEREAYCQKILMDRMQDKTLDEGAIWSDITTFDGKPWCGKIDMLIGGFPCQDVSHCGKKEGIKEGSRSGLYYHYIRLVDEIRPSYVFVENVSGLLDNRAMGIVLGELAERGFDAEWGMFSAESVGSSHKRDRVFILAHSNDPGNSPLQPKAITYRAEGIC